MDQEQYVLDCSNDGGVFCFRLFDLRFFFFKSVYSLSGFACVITCGIAVFAVFKDRNSYPVFLVYSCVVLQGKRPKLISGLLWY